MDRCEKLLKETGCPVLITSDENCFYYSGFTGGESALLIADGYRGIFTDTRYTIQAKQEAPDFEVTDKNVLIEMRKVINERGIKLLGFEEARLSVASFSLYSDMAKLVPCGAKINGVRKIKSESELAKIREAQKIAESAFVYFTEHAHIGMTEIEAAFLLESYMRKNGAKKTSFDTVVATGARGAMPHAVAGKTVIKKGDMVVLDFGCVFDSYCSDMTRTVAFGNPPDKGREIYEIVKEANFAALNAARAGITAGELDSVARDIITEYGYGDKFGHSLGHGVGIEIHEPPYARPKGKELLEAGMTVTIEPGIYLPGICGVRIEDLVVLTKTGCENLNKTSKDLLIL